MTHFMLIDNRFTFFMVLLFKWQYRECHLDYFGEKLDIKQKAQSTFCLLLDITSFSRNTEFCLSEPKIWIVINFYFIC